MAGLLAMPTQMTDLEAGFLEVYDREARVILAYLRGRVDDPAEAEDLAADTFLRAWQHWAGFQHRDIDPRHWLLRIARNLVIDRARRRRRVALVQLDDGIAGSEGTERLAVERMQLRQALARLSDEERDLISLRAAGLSFPEIARTVGKGESAVKMAWHRAAQRLQVWLEL